MRFDTRNLSIIRAHGFKTNTSKSTPVSALADGICVACSGDVKAGQPICWHRKHGVFHARCYQQVPGSTTGGVDESTVREMIDDALASREVTPSNNNNNNNNAATVTAESVIAAVRAYFGDSRAVSLTLKKLDGTIKTIQNVHAEFKKLCYLVNKRKHVYLYGPPGSGKSTAAKMAADANELPFGYISLNPQTPESRLLGFIDANGVYRPTVFRTMYEKGGIYCIDEMDNAAAMLLTTLNSCLENGVAAFPDGMVNKHPDFIVVSTGNTTGRGGNKQFPDRRAFDAAFAGRFAFLFWGYDEVLERRVALQIEPTSVTWVEWVQNVRRWATENDPQLVVSPRETYHIVSALADRVLDAREITETFLFKGVEAPRVRRIVDVHPMPALPSA